MDPYHYHRLRAAEESDEVLAENVRIIAKQFVARAGYPWDRAYLDEMASRLNVETEEDTDEV